MDLIQQAALWLVPLVAAIVLHEVSHGWVANALGDPTARRLGRLTLNPVRHADPVGTVVLPLLLAIAHAPIFGWAKPVPVNRERLHHPRRDMVLVALAGPGINLSLALATAVVLGLVGQAGLGAGPGDAPGYVATLLVNFILVNVFLALFNLIPLPPFDGGHVVEGLLPRTLAARWAAMGRFAFPIMLVLLLVLPQISPSLNIVQRLVAPPASAVIAFLLGIANQIA